MEFIPTESDKKYKEYNQLADRMKRELFECSGIPADKLQKSVSQSTENYRFEAFLKNINPSLKTKT